MFWGWVDDYTDECWMERLEPKDLKRKSQVYENLIELDSGFEAIVQL